MPYLARLVLPLVLVLAVGCSGESITVPGDQTGTLEVTTVTTGAEPDADGYIVQMDADSPQQIGVQATVQTPNLVPGAHSVQLAGLASNCTVSGDNPRSVTVSAGETAQVSFEVTCAATTGSLQVTAATAGDEPDADGYSISVDGVDQGALQASGSLSLAAVPVGDRVVGLTGIAANCQVQGENPRTVSVIAGSGATAAFAVTCSAPPASAGTLTITTATTGADPDGNGYAFAINGGTTQPIAVSGTASLPNLAAGALSVRLSDVASNCAVQGENPRPVTLAAGATAAVAFAVTCTATTGTVRVTTSTSGASTDPNGYKVILDGAGGGTAITTSGTVTLPRVSPGAHAVALTDVASTCTVEGGASRNTTVTVGATAEVAFRITCAAPSPTTGSVKVTTTTSGPNPDDGYTLSVNSGATQSIVANGSVSVGNLAPGEHQVTLGGLAPNCTTAGANPRPVTVTAGAEAQVAFAITCTSTSSGATRWTTIPLPPGHTGSSIWASSASDIFVVAGNGGSGVVLHHDGHAWTESLRGTDSFKSPRAVWGSSPTDVFVAGWGAIWRYNGSGWADTPMESELLTGIWGASSQDVYAVGSADFSPPPASLYHFNGLAWGSPGPGTTWGYGQAFDVAGSAPNDVYAIGVEDAPPDALPEDNYQTSRLVHWNGSSWTTSFEQKSGAGHVGFALYGVWSLDPNDAFLVGGGGKIYHFDGTTWTPMISPTTKWIRDIWGNAHTNMYAVGDDGIVHYDGTTWKVINNTTTATGVWGVGTDVFVLNGSTILHGTP